MRRVSAFADTGRYFVGEGRLSAEGFRAAILIAGIIRRRFDQHSVEIVEVGEPFRS